MMSWFATRPEQLWESKMFTWEDEAEFYRWYDNLGISGMAYLSTGIFLAIPGDVLPLPFARRGDVLRVARCARIHGAPLLEMEEGAGRGGHPHRDRHSRLVLPEWDVVLPLVVVGRRDSLRIRYVLQSTVGG